MDFQNKVVLVTGASSGIGAAIALEFTKHGADVVIVGRTESKLNNVANKCAQNGKEPLVLIADVTDDSEVKKVVDQIINTYGKLNVLVNNAGSAGFGSILAENAIETFDRVIAINLRAAVCLSHFAAPHLITNGGNIINISSIGSLAVLSPTQFSYNASKAGLDHFTRGIALELASKGVRVNCVNPGPVKTDFVDSITTDKEEQEKIWDNLSMSTAIGKVSESSEIADLVLYLASDKANSITGSSFVVDNGMLLKGSIII
ncbi:uncharacterized oxidoreductase YxbG-like [Epargyreus clarus]|uniref:uncharacterized oxidoreductase YxbG-like n=1 Tax=Epargyreus clarus TaxID=520877 RepID=UPI003C2C854E